MHVINWKLMILLYILMLEMLLNVYIINFQVLWLLPEIGIKLKSQKKNI